MPERNGDMTGFVYIWRDRQLGKFYTKFDLA
jgi:hypothetical protein